MKLKGHTGFYPAGNKSGSGEGSIESPDATMIWSDEDEVRSMSNSNVEKRLQALEAEVAELKRHLGASPENGPDWLKIRWGAFAGDAAHEEAMRLGAEWRKRENAKSLRRPKKKRKNVRS